MSKKFSTAHFSWADRFALIDHFAPSDQEVCTTFNVTDAELLTARQLRDSGTFAASKTLDVDRYAGIFSGTPTLTPSNSKAFIMPTTTPTTTAHVMPESATKKPRTTTNTQQKRGRKGDKITSALMAAPTSPVSVQAFMQEHGVSLAVLRQSKRFIQKLDPATQDKIGTVVVKQDKTTKELMIHRVDNSQSPGV